jgi:hypothetical protein
MSRPVFVVGEDARMKVRLPAAVLLAAIATPVAASVLYKSMDANGTITFSDQPPPPDSRLLESRALGAPHFGSPSSAEIAGLPASATALEEAYQMIDYDRALREANERVDLAEHALALARAGHARTPRPGLNGGGLSLAEAERIEFHQRDLRAARMALAELLRSRQLASGRPLR